MHALRWILSVLSELLKMSFRVIAGNVFQWAICVPPCVLRNEQKIGVEIDKKCGKEGNFFSFYFGKKKKNRGKETNLDQCDKYRDFRLTEQM